ncbi:hypothetical protein V6R21_15080 [Limibacter armeniacum]|uniref:hypothetical protein n=1 Tax=Limibacter armeniacum TaxID=466084 RepID=UPI002FE626BC
MEDIFKYFWVLLFLTVLLNGIILNAKSKKYIEQNPTLEAGYKGYIKKFMLFGSIPCLLIGFGNESGLTNSVFDYLIPNISNPIVILFHLMIVVYWVMRMRWIYFKEGAEFLEAHSGLLRDPNVTAKKIKLLTPLPIIGWFVMIILMWGNIFPV